MLYFINVRQLVMKLIALFNILENAPNKACRSCFSKPLIHQIGVPCIF